MNQTGIIIAAVVAAIVADIILIALWQRKNKKSEGSHLTGFLGTHSVMPAWLRSAPLPQLHMPISVNRVRQIGLILALLLAAFSQWQLLKNPETPGWALTGYVVAALLFVWTSRKIHPDNSSESFAAVLPQGMRRRIYIPAILLAASGATSLFTIMSVDRGNTGPRDYVLVVSWWLSIIFYVSAVLVLAQWRWPSRVRSSDWWHNNWKETVVLLSLAAIAFAARVIDLPWLPYAMINDEGRVGLSALDILQGNITNLFTISWSAQPTWSFVPNAIMISILGTSLTALRLASVIAGTLAVICLYLLARETFGREVAFLAALGLTGLAWHINFSRLAVHNVVDSLTAVAAMWLAFRAFQRGKLTDYLWAGLMTGLVVYTYVGSRLVIVLVLGLLAFSWMRRSMQLRRHTIHLLVFVGAAAIVAGPMLAYFYHHSDKFMARMNDVSLLTNGHLEQLAIDSGQSIPAVLVSQFSKSTLVYVTGSAYAQFFNSPRPYLPAMGALFLILGLAYATWRIREPRYFAVVFWFWIVVILGSTLTYGPPSHQRMLMAAPATALLVAIGLWQAARLSTNLGMLSYKVALAVCVVIMGISSYQGIAHYFGEYRLGHFSEDPAEEFSHEVSLALKALGPEYRLVVIGAPMVTIEGHANFGYLARGFEQMGFDTVHSESLATLPLDKGLFFTAIPMRENDLKKIAEWLPGGEWTDVPRRFQPDEISYHAYRVSPEIAAAALAAKTATVDPYEQVVPSPNGKLSAKLRVNWADLNEKPMIEIWDNNGSLLWDVEYQFPEVSQNSMLSIQGWSQDSAKVFFYYPFWLNDWYTIFKGSHLQSLDPLTGKTEDVVTGCCIDFVFSEDMSRLAYTSETRVGIKDLKSGVDKSVEILPHTFSQSGLIHLSPSGDRLIFHTLSGNLGTIIFLDTNSMEQKIILNHYLIMEIDFNGWTEDENPIIKKGDKIFVIDLDTLEQTIVETAIPQP